MSARRRTHEGGMAIVTVVVLLAALMLIAAPFALSMRRMESGALLAADQEGARAGALAALAAAERHLEDTHPYYDLETPHVDTRDELLPPDLAERFAGQLDRNPRGAVRSVLVEDEQGKVHLPTASVFLLGNLLGGRTTLTSDAGPLDDRLDVASTDGFAPTGLLWLPHELVEYSARERTGFAETRRGQVDACVPTSRTREHRRGEDVIDLRVLALAQHGWRARPGVFDVFPRVDAMKQVGLYAPVTFTSAEVEAVRDLVTVHGAPVAWRDRQPVHSVGRARTFGAALVVDDASRWGTGTLVQIVNDDGEADWGLVHVAYPWDDRWRVELFDALVVEHDERSTIEALRREPVNVATCSATVLEALLVGVGRRPLAHVVDPDAAVQLAVSLPRDTSLELSEVFERLEEQLDGGRLVEDDVVAAWTMVQETDLRLAALEPEEIAPQLVGLRTHRPPLRVSPDMARRVAARLVADRPTSHAELRAHLDAAVAAGELGAVQREALLRNAVDPGDVWLTGGTAPFTYASGGTFTLAAAASENLASGRERARAHVRRVESIAPGGETTHRFATQRDFERGLDLGPGGHGWASFPALLDVGGAPRATALAARVEAPTIATVDADALVVPSAALDPARTPPSRATALVAGLPGPSDAEPRSAVAPRPVRSPLPDTLHFDEGVDGLVGATPKGFSFAEQGSLTMPLELIEPRVVSSLGRLDAFTVEFWMEFEQVPEGDAVLFDGGLDELEDRVLIALLDGELVLRVHDASLPDFEADVGDDGLVPPTGEIRYAFDDGLELLPHVPYHVLAEIGGAGPRDLALWVDGVPRGRRSFATFLTADVEPSGASGSLLASGVERLPVDSTAGFPRQGVLDVGYELIEYIDLEDDAFVVGPLDDGDPFGGRSRRRSLAAKHLAGTAVNLAGYSIPLASDLANRGNQQLAAPLGEFGIAMLDASRLDDTISASVITSAPSAPTIEIVLGTGLLSTASSIPVVGAGTSSFSNDTFSQSGGHAMIVAVHDSYALTLDVPGGATGETFRFPQTTTDGDAIDGVEIIRYTGFDGQTLTGVSRNASGLPASSGGPPSDLIGGGFSSGGLNAGTSFDDPRVFVTEYDGALTANGQIPDQPRVLVVPLSIPLAATYEEYAPRPESNTNTSALAQIDLDFGEGDGTTEWVRWNTATSVGLVRDDGDAIDDTIERIAQLDAWDTNSSVFTDDTVDTIGNALDMRGQCGTPDVAHADGARVLPTHLFGGWGVNVQGMAGAGYGAPGRTDAITLVNVKRGDSGEILTSKEWHRVNHAELDDRDAASDRVSGAWLVGLRDPVVGEFVRTDEFDRDNYGIEDGQVDEVLEPDQTGYDEVTALQVDVRLVTRMIKAPSRELPTGPLLAFHVGRDFGGRRTEADVTIDELRFTTRAAPDDLIPTTATFLLADELEDDEQRELRIDLDALRAAHVLLDRPILGPGGLAAAGMVSQAGGLLWVGDELVSYAGFDDEDSGTVYLTGRGLYGTRVQAHPRFTPVRTLPQWPASPLSARVTEDSAVLPLGDVASFPPGPGLVLVDEELVGYSEVTPRSLSMPHTGGVTTISRRGLLRGRHGTRAAEHAAGALVRWMPMRHRDHALLGSGHATSDRAVLTVHAPGAFVTDVAIAARIAAPGARLDVRAVLDRRVAHHATPDPARGALAAFASDGVGDVVVAGSIGRRASVVDLHLLAGWDEGAFDPRGFTANGWKVAPHVTSVTLAHVQPTLVWEHEEWR